ncbi:hypothetical protein F5Y09DRAFT_342286 [Xylaria sp. FL1042]|nr:hypothetical protein F5Y09DRAFT_342286 [Xylaria sp. FL1042]
MEARVPEQCTCEPHPRAALDYLTVHVPGSSPRPALRRGSRHRGRGCPRSRSDSACTDSRRLRPASGAILVAAGVLVPRPSSQCSWGRGQTSESWWAWAWAWASSVSPAQAILEFQSLYPSPSATGVGGLGSTVLIGDAS